MKRTHFYYFIIGLLLCSGLILCSCTTSNVQSSETSDEISADKQEESATQEAIDVSQESFEDENLVNIRYDMINIEEIILVDNEDFTYKITGVDPYDNGGKSYTLTAEKIIKNENPNTDLFFHNITINGMICNYTGTQDSQSSKCSISFDYLELSKMGITDITDIGIYYNIGEKTSEYGYAAGATETLHIYPYGEENAEQFVYQETGDEIIILDNEYMEIYAMDFSGCNANLLIHNKTDQFTFVDIYNKTVNGIETKGWWNVEAYGNTYQYRTLIPFSLDTIVTNNITNINEIELIIYLGAMSMEEIVTINTDFPINMVEYTSPNGELTEVTNFENTSNLAKYTATLNQSVGSIFNFSESSTQILLYNGAHYELTENEIRIIVPESALDLYVLSDQVVDIFPFGDDTFRTYTITFNESTSETELPIFILHSDGNLEKLTLYLTISQ